MSSSKIFFAMFQQVFLAVPSLREFGGSGCYNAGSAQLPPVLGLQPRQAASHQPAGVTVGLGGKPTDHKENDEGEIKERNGI